MPGAMSIAMPAHRPSQRRVPFKRCRARPLALTAAWLGLLGALLSAVPEARAAPRLYTVQAEASTLKILVYRQGALSALAHDHVLVAHGLEGQAQVDPADVGHASLRLSVPVAALEVDPAPQREQEGFTSEITAPDRQSLRETMLGPGQLHAEAFPAVTLALEEVRGALPDLALRLRVAIRGQERTITVPARVTLTERELAAQGQVELLQSDWGIVPYRTLLGAIAVQDRVLVKFSIVAIAKG